jgi:hypothetical protein
MTDAQERPWSCVEGIGIASRAEAAPDDDGLVAADPDGVLVIAHSEK